MRHCDQVFSLKRLPLLLVLLACLCLASRGQSTSTASASTLNGDWRLDFGDSSQSEAARPSEADFTIAMEDGTIYVQGLFWVICPSRIPVRLIGRGHIGGDGTFAIQNALPLKNNPAQISIRGKIPGGREDRWAGTISTSAFVYSVPETPQNCPAISASFMAIRFAPLTGSYSGSIRFQRKDPDGYISVQISAPQLVTTHVLSPFDKIIEARARITIAGSSHIPSGTYETTPDWDPASGKAGSSGCSTSYGRQISISFGENPDCGNNLHLSGRFDPDKPDVFMVGILYPYKNEQGHMELANESGQLTRDDENR